jgi:DNA-binding NarL/FixJ family response regulator
MDESKDIKQSSPGIERIATRIASSRTDVAKWDHNIVIFLFAVLAIVIILVSLEVDTKIVAPVAILGLAMAWLMGRRRGKQLFQGFYAEELAGLKQEPNEEAAALMEHLTSREIEILNCVAQGFSNKQIALELGISINTVKDFISKILAKLNANDRTEAVVIAIKQGTLSIE